MNCLQMRQLVFYYQFMSSVVISQYSDILCGITPFLEKATWDRYCHILIIITRWELIGLWGRIFGRGRVQVNKIRFSMDYLCLFRIIFVTPILHNFGVINTHYYRGFFLMYSGLCTFCLHTLGLSSPQQLSLRSRLLHVHGENVMARNSCRGAEARCQPEPDTIPTLFI